MVVKGKNLEWTPWWPSFEFILRNASLKRLQRRGMNGLGKNSEKVQSLKSVEWAEQRGFVGVQVGGLVQIGGGCSVEGNSRTGSCPGPEVFPEQWAGGSTT